MRRPRLTVFVAVLAFAASCSSRDAVSDTTQADADSADSVAPASSISWFEGAEPLLLAPAPSSDRGLVVAADSLAPDLEDGDLEQHASLVRLDGTIATALVTLSSGSEGCVDAALSPAPPAPWSVGFLGGSPTAVRVDSIRSISRQDSLRLTPIVFRLASSVPNSPGGRFAGLPFALVDLWRLRAADGRMIVVATTRRQINQEDSPLEERTLIVAEGDSTGTEFSLTHSSRSSGPEETVEGAELLAVVSFAARREMEFVLSHDFGDETSYSIVERRARDSWKTLWASRRFTC